MLWDPVRYDETCPSSDGAAAMVIGSEKAAGAATAATGRPPAWIHGMAMRSEPTMFAGRDQVNPQAGRDCAADLAVTIVLALRKRILTDGSGDGPDRANAAYKEWRGARVERLCTDAARRAFEIGVVAASHGRHVRFFVAPNDAPCDVCAMDAASGERPAGSNFPSGSAFPPLHAGCACAVLPV